MRNLTIPLVLLLSFVGCDQQPTAPVGEETPALNWMNNPDNGNVRIARFQEHFAFSWTDPRNGLRATHTTLPLPIGLPQETDCGPQAELDPLDVQDVGLFIEGEEFFLSQLHRNQTGRLWVIIRDVNQVGDCFGNKLIAEGLGEVHNTDNDLFGVGPEANNANAFGVGASGTLTKVGGGTLRYTGHARFTVVIKPGREPEFTHAQFIVNVH